MEKVRIGVVGVGAISGIYLENITARFRELEIVGVWRGRPWRSTAFPSNTPPCTICLPIPRWTLC